MIPSRLSKVNHRMHAIEKLRGNRALGGDDVPNEDWALSVSEVRARGM